MYLRHITLGLLTNCESFLVW